MTTNQSNTNWRQWLILEPLHATLVSSREPKQEQLRHLKALIALIVLMVTAGILWAIYPSIDGLSSNHDTYLESSSSKILVNIGLSILIIFGLPALGTSVGREAIKGMSKIPDRPLDKVKTFVGFMVGVLVTMLISSATLNYFSEWFFTITGLDSIFPIVDPVEEELMKILTRGDNIHYTLIFLSICICPAIAEELFFRGVMDRTLEYQLPSRPYVTLFISSAIFSLLHLSAVGFLARLTMGMLLGYSYRKTNRLYVPILLHLVNNLLATIFIFL